MKSLNHFPQKSAKSSMTRSERSNQEVEQRINEILFHSMQLQRTLWLVVQANSGVVTIDETSVDPLWNLEYTRPEGKPNLLTLTASRLPEATDEQLDKLAAALLKHQPGDPSDAIDKVGLSNHPKSYTIKALQSRAIYATPPGGKANVWMTRTEHDLHFPPASA